MKKRRRRCAPEGAGVDEQQVAAGKVRPANQLNHAEHLAFVEGMETSSINAGQASRECWGIPLGGSVLVMGWPALPRT